MKKKTKDFEIKKNKEEDLSLKQLIFDKSNLYILICLFIVAILFIPTLNRPWLIYDERIIYDSFYFPLPSSFSELFEIINQIGSHFNVVSSNSLYSSNFIIRACPLTFVLYEFTSFIFKKNHVLFHLLSLTLHLINTCLFYLILKTCIRKNRFLLVILTLIWAVHPIMTESILLTTNFGATLSYLFFFGFLLDFLINRQKNNSLIRQIIIPAIYLIPLFTNEYIITLPLVFFIISFFETYKTNPLKKAFANTAKETRPYFTGLAIYLFFFLFKLNFRIVHSTVENQLLVLIERIFWLAPQIFFHHLKLVFYPKLLSTDQSLFVTLGKTIFSPYSVFCILFLFGWLFIPLILFINKRRFSNLFLISWTFFFALLPFLHILAPTYLLAAERYLYCPLALMIFGLSKILMDRAGQRPTPTIPIILSFILAVCFIRSYVRTLDWKENFTFLSSTFKVTKDPLLKATKLFMIAETVGLLDRTQPQISQKYFLSTIDFLNNAKKEILPLKLKYQKHLPLIIKSYGLDYDAILAKIAFLEVTTRCLKLNENYQVGLNILKPYMKRPQKLDPRIFEFYSNWLILDKKLAEAKTILEKSNSIYPHISSILMPLYDIATKYDKDEVQAEKYLSEALQFYPLDVSILGKAILFYQEQKNYLLAARYAYLYGLITQSKIAYGQALVNYLDGERPQDAGTVANKLIQIAPNDPESLYFISKYYYKINNKEKAISILSSAYALSLQSNTNKKLTFDIGHTLAKLYHLSGDNEQAISLAKNIFNFTGNDSESLIKLARLYKSLKLTEDFNHCVNKLQSLGKVITWQRS